VLTKQSFIRIVFSEVYDTKPAVMRLNRSLPTEGEVASSNVHTQTRAVAGRNILSNTQSSKVVCLQYVYSTGVYCATVKVILCGKMPCTWPAKSATDFSF
jgi:hypothetical protein